MIAFYGEVGQYQAWLLLNKNIEVSLTAAINEMLNGGRYYKEFKNAGQEDK